MPRIALRAAPGRMNGFVTIKRVKDYFLWYYEANRQVLLTKQH